MITADHIIQTVRKKTSSPEDCCRTIPRGVGHKIKADIVLKIRITASFHQQRRNLILLSEIIFFVRAIKLFIFSDVVVDITA